MTETTLSWTQPLTSALRGEEDLLAQLRRRDDLTTLLWQSLLASLVGAAVFGIALGSYGGSPAQVIASAIKVPLLLLGTTALCFPSFYVLQTAKAPEPMSLVQAAALQATALSTIGAIWGALSMPLFFLVVTTGQYMLAQFLALAVGGMGGLVGLLRLRRGYMQLCSAESGKRMRLPLLLYLVIFGSVGGQMAWVLRPFIGSPILGFELVRSLESNFFAHVLRLFGIHLFGA